MRKRLVIEIAVALLVVAACVCVTVVVYQPDPSPPPFSCEYPVELRFADGGRALLCDQGQAKLQVILARHGLEKCTELVARELKGGAYPQSVTLGPGCRVTEYKEGTLTGDGSRLAGVKLDVNQATAGDLETVPGIGKATSAAIVSERAANGPFCPLDTLIRVKGIGDKKLEQFSAYLTARCE